MFKLYSLLYLLGFLFYLPKEILKRKNQEPFKWLREKLGMIEPPAFEIKRPVIWIHAVSVGEVLAVSPLIELLSKTYNIVLTTITLTGREVAKKRLKDLPVKIYYLPLDLKLPLLNFLKKTEAKVLLITETELWPNLIDTISKKIPVALINGRITERSFKRYKLFKFFFKPLLNRLKFLAVQEEIYAERFKALGVNSEKIKIVGNLKFDLSIPERDFKELEALPKPIIIAGSTHYPEEKIILQSFLKAVNKGTLIIVPRHPERFREVEEIILSQINSEVDYLRYTTLKHLSLSSLKSQVVLLFDEMGVLSSLYKIGNLAIIGGSFIPHGGQNPLEAIYWKKPVITGPHMENFPFIKEFVKEKAIIETPAKNLPQVLKSLFENEKLMQNMAEKAYKLFLSKRGALERTKNLIDELLC
ncbi:MAG: 3-deoxy-D-manno-octulosonic acid transferase [Caldimicrobium thiodismutans]|uniref:3-deoxy-D-manno-octulosonic acid transferase n=1 Tax=Caldimicrobium thiodismutans TaxID=1653476 RepID=A0A2N7PKS6_9BACT|nr:MAG: 3-deoxy-D-manno-octulosonic acid transferase [Caldimicrobium thiodismutans]